MTTMRDQKEASKKSKSSTNQNAFLFCLCCLRQKQPIWLPFLVLRIIFPKKERLQSGPDREEWRATTTKMRMNGRLVSLPPTHHTTFSPLPLTNTTLLHSCSLSVCWRRPNMLLQSLRIQAQGPSAHNHPHSKHW